MIKEKQKKKKMLKILLAFQKIFLLLVFLNLDFNIFCESFDEMKEKLEDENWWDWTWNNKGKILIITGVVSVGLIMGYYYFIDSKIYIY